jgi:hypothetical protein
MFRAKFLVGAITPNGEGRGSTISLHTQYDPEVPEDQRFSLATPSGYMQMQVTNPVVLDQLKQGQVYYLDFSEVPKA